MVAATLARKLGGGNSSLIARCSLGRGGVCSHFGVQRCRCAHRPLTPHALSHALSIQKNGSGTEGRKIGQRRTRGRVAGWAEAHAARRRHSAAQRGGWMVRPAPTRSDVCAHTRRAFSSVRAQVPATAKIPAGDAAKGAMGQRRAQHTARRKGERVRRRRRPGSAALRGAACNSDARACIFDARVLRREVQRKRACVAVRILRAIRAAVRVRSQSSCGALPSVLVPAIPALARSVPHHREGRRQQAGPEPAWPERTRERKRARIQLHQGEFGSDTRRARTCLACLPLLKLRPPVAWRYFSSVAQRCPFSLWALQAAPPFIGADLSARCLHAVIAHQRRSHRRGSGCARPGCAPRVVRCAARSLGATVKRRRLGRGSVQSRPRANPGHRELVAIGPARPAGGARSVAANGSRPDR